MEQISIFDILELQKENERLKKALDKAGELLGNSAMVCPPDIYCESVSKSCDECWKEWLTKDD